jgi:beta-glucosidase
LYAAFPGSKVERPAIALKGFKRVFVPKGRTVEVSIPIKAEDLKYWSVEKHAFVLEKGKIEFFLGPSSADTKLKGQLVVR